MGYLAASLFILLSAARDVWGFVILKQWPVQLVVFGSFVFTTLVANLYLFFKKNREHPYKKSLFMDLFFINLTTAISWIATFIGMAKILPAALASLVVGFLPIATLLLDRFLRGNAITKKALLGAGIVFVGIIFVSWSEVTAGHSLDKTQAFIGILACLLASAFAAGNNVFAKRLNDAGVGATAVFGARFWLLLVIAGLWVLVANVTPPTDSQHSWRSIYLLGIFGVAVPIYFLHIAIEKVGPKIVGFLIASIPVVVLVIQYASGVHTKIEIPGMVGVILVCLGIVQGSLKRPPKFAKKKALG